MADVRDDAFDADLNSSPKPPLPSASPLKMQNKELEAQELLSADWLFQEFCMCRGPNGWERRRKPG